MMEEICKCGHAKEWHDGGRDYCQARPPLPCSCRSFDKREEPPAIPAASSPPKSEATFFKEEVEALLNGRYKNMSVYQTVGALEVVKTNLLERLGRMGGGQ